MGRKAVDTRKYNKVGTRGMFARILLAFCVIALLMIGLVSRIIYLNKEKGNVYTRRVLSQRSYSSSEIGYKRGDILDRNRNKLASSKKTYDMALDPNIMLSDNEITKATKAALKKVFDISEETISAILKEQAASQYYPMQDYKDLDKELVKSFKSMVQKDKKIKGVIFEERYERYYPYSTVGSKIIGFCSTEGKGIWGIENQYDSDLTGMNGRSFGYFNSELELEETIKEPTDGNTVVSTIDVNVQGILERHMKEFQQRVGSLNMGCLIMNPQNGEVYAMSDYPGFDLNNPRDLTMLYSEEEIENMPDKKLSDALNKLWRNYCISDAFEPGSTFKPMTVAACLDEGVTNENRGYVCDGFQKVGGIEIKCVAKAKGGHGTINICQSLMDSCNDVLMQLGAALGRDKFLSYNSDFGFGRKTGIDLPGEASGGVFNRETMHSVELATSSFGQGQTVTMIQLATAFCATINGGSYYEPHVVKEVDTPSGGVASAKDNTLVRRVITEETSRKIREYLYKTVEEGSASPAKVPGYEIGGKTGTAEKHPTGRGNYLVSFAGFTPVDKPEIMIYVVIDEPHVEDQAHSVYATEFSAEVLKEVLPLFGIYQSADTKKKDKTKATDIQIPSNTREVPEGGYADGEYKVAKE